MLSLVKFSKQNDTALLPSVAKPKQLVDISDIKCRVIGNRGRGRGGGTPDLEIVLSVSGNFNVFTEKFLQKERIYWVKNT